ncbi:hypothetical protein EV182_006783 [Spiromyces aspiralis]|uniref:Uncharacterized protein n=1 Tax=Spiromyces aspiralis TaxID=68401 RepID=A0ACC1HPF1_9FUNG|nr:hypothetical protein EV182_006783 [Spiromyces aspiralis]
MEEPLFGGISRRDLMMERAVSGVVLTTACITVLMSLIKGFVSSYVHILLGLVIAIFTYCEILLVKWYRIGDLEPKFKYMIAALAVGIVSLCLVANLYFWL